MPLRKITQGAWGQGPWVLLGFVEVGDRSASSCPKSSMVPASLLRSRPLGAPEFSFWPNRSPVRPLRTWASGFQQRNGVFTTILFGSKSSAPPPPKIISKKWVLVSAAGCSSGLHHRSRGAGVCKEMDQGRFRGTSRIPRCAFDIHLEVRE